MEEHKHTHAHRHETVFPDSVEIGTAGKGGGFKVYHNADDVAGFNKKIDNMAEVMKHLREKVPQV
jgi:hypothetical protein